MCICVFVVIHPTSPPPLLDHFISRDRFFCLGFWDLSYTPFVFLLFFFFMWTSCFKLAHNIWPGNSSKKPTFQQSLVHKEARLKCCTSTTDNIKTSFPFLSSCRNPAKQLDYKDLKAFSSRINLHSGRQQQATAVRRLEQDKEENKRWLLPKRLAQMLQRWGLDQK